MNADDEGLTTSEASIEAQVVLTQTQLVDDLPLNDFQTQSVFEAVDWGAENDPHMSSLVENVVVVVLHIGGRDVSHGQSPMDPTGVVLEEEWEYEVICLDNDDDMPKRHMEINVKVKERDHVL